MMKFEQLFSYVGDFGPYQQRVLFVLCYGSVLSAFKAFVILFILDIPPHRCSLGVNDTYAIQNDDHAHLVNMSIPREMYRGQATWSSCYMYESPNNHSSSDTVKCQDWVFDRSVYQSTLTEAFEIVCDNRILRSHINMVSFIGQLVGTIFIGPLSDRFGRRRVCLVSSFIMVVSFFSCSFVTNVYVFMVLRAVVNFSQMGSALPAFVLGMEVCAPRKRVFVGMAWQTAWGVGLLCLCLIAYFIRHWQTLHLTLAAPLIAYTLWYWLVPESPRWLMSKRRFSEAKAEILKMVSVNKVTLSEDVIDEVQVEKEESVKLTNWFSHRSLSIITVIIFFNWFAVSVVYYGLGLNVQNLTGDIYLNFAIASIVELASYALCTALLDRVGRKALHCTCMLIGGAACIATIFPVLYGTQELDWVTVALAMVGKFGISGGFAVIYIYTAELFPTVMRNTGMSISSFWARVGGIISPYLADIGILIGGDLRVILPLLIFGGVAVSAGLLSLLLPETLGKELPETIQDAKHLRRYKSPKPKTSNKRDQNQELERLKTHNDT